MHTARFTVFFEEPFWVGVYERADGGKLLAARVVFGAEPKDANVYAFLLQHWGGLRFSPPVAEEQKHLAAHSPKRMQREARRQLSDSGAGTKAQQALKLLQAENARERKVRTREQRDADAERRFELHQQKRREKHRGR